MCTKFGLRWPLACDTRRGNGRCFVSMLNTIAKHQPVDRCWLCTPLALAVPRCALPRRFWLAISWGGSHWRHGVSNWFVQFLVHILLTSKRAAPSPSQLFNCVLHAEIANWITLGPGRKPNASSCKQKTEQGGVIPSCCQSQNECRET